MTEPLLKDSFADVLRRVTEERAKNAKRAPRKIRHTADWVRQNWYVMLGEIYLAKNRS